MGRIASQMKAALSLTCSAAASIAFGVASRRFDQPAGRWALPAVLGGTLLLIQLLLLFVKSKEDVELAEFKRIQSAENERSAAQIEARNKLASAATERALVEIRSGNLEEAQRWSDFGRSHHGQ